MSSSSGFGQGEIGLGSGSNFFVNLSKSLSPVRVLQTVRFGFGNNLNIRTGADTFPSFPPLSSSKSRALMFCILSSHPSLNIHQKALSGPIYPDSGVSTAVCVIIISFREL